MAEMTIELDESVLFRVCPRGGPGINSLGYRDHEFPSKGERRRILFLGDSFVMGLNVPAEKALPKALEQRLGSPFEVFNMGVFSYGPDQSYLRLLEDGVDLQPDALLLSLFPANDFNDLAKNELFRLDHAGRLVRNEHNPVSAALAGWRLSFIVRRALTGQPFAADIEQKLLDRLIVDTYDPLAGLGAPKARQKIELMRGILARVKAQADARRLPFAVVIIPSYEAIIDPATLRRHGIPSGLSLYNEAVAAELCQKLEIPYLSLAEAFQRVHRAALYSPVDHHLSAEGNELAATLLERFLVERHLLPRLHHDSRKQTPGDSSRGLASSS